MCLLRKITYGEFSEFVREKKITYEIHSCVKTRGPFFSFVLLPLLYSRTNQPTANKNSYERSGRAEREKRIYEVDFLLGKGAHASEIRGFRMIK